MEQRIVTHVHHHFTFYVDSNPVATLDPLRLSSTVDLQLDHASVPCEQDDGAAHLHKHVFHRLMRGREDVMVVTEEEKALARSNSNWGREESVVHHFYDRVRVSSVGGRIKQGEGYDVADLRKMLRQAVRLELSTIPPYLFAMYSIKDRKCAAYGMLASIAVEEMLHAGLAANMLTAIGGVVPFYADKAMPTYPLDVGFLSLRLELRPLSKDCVASQFMRLEEPCSVEQDLMASTKESFKSIGAFYAMIEAAFEGIYARQPDLFAKPNPQIQMKGRSYKVVEHNSAESGVLHPITNIDDVRAAIHTILHQGEGVEDEVYADASQVELTHFRKLELIHDMHVEAYNCAPNPKTADFPAHMQPVSQLFNLVYSWLMLTMQEIYSEVDVAGKLNQRIFVLMEKFLRPLGQLLCATPMNDTFHCGPTFEPVLFETGAEPIEMVRALGKEVLTAFPSLQEKMGKGLKSL